MGEIADILRGYGYNPTEAQKSEMRWLTWLHENARDVSVDRHFDAVTDSDVNQLVIVDNIDVNMCCPHHLLPVVLKVHIGYLPDGQILGLSKFARIAKDLAKMKLQEEYTQELVDVIGYKLQADWAMVIVAGQHTCMTCRGIEAKDSETVTSAIWGLEYDTHDQLKNEFINFVTHKMR